ncbi:MAG TPA: hypothetical protein VJ840_14705 [Gemmatimonadaceae bacterium]|nr:hypothetical protein [Gemmatimonadaceae bacterium]
MRTLRFAALLAIVACATATSTPIAEVAGTWGGDNAGLIVDQTDVHIHIGCTLGDAVGPIKPDADGRFAATGTYNVDAYPVNRGTTHPASFTGRIVGETMTLTVSLTDTARVLGPVTLVYGKEPQMGACPICRVPPGHSGRGIDLGAHGHPQNGSGEL